MDAVAEPGLPENRIRVVTAKIGGSFGLKMQGHPEETLVALASLVTGAPVKWIEDRRETLMAGAREQVHHVSVGATADGRLVALRDRIVADCGALSAQPGWAMPNMSATTLPSCYRLLDVDVELHVVATNKPPMNAARGFGKDAAHFVMERAVDLVARRLGLDPADVRRTNLIGADEFPFRTADRAATSTAATTRACSTRCSSAVDFDARRAGRSRARAEGRLLGWGSLRAHPRVGRRSRAARVRLRHDHGADGHDRDGHRPHRRHLTGGATTPGSPRWSPRSSVCR